MTTPIVDATPAKATLKSGKENQDIHTQSEPSLIFIPPEHGPIVPPQSAA
jgi:hypothetical protein